MFANSLALNCHLRDNVYWSENYKDVTEMCSVRIKYTANNGSGDGKTGKVITMSLNVAFGKLEKGQ